MEKPTRDKKNIGTMTDIQHHTSFIFLVSVNVCPEAGMGPSYRDNELKSPQQFHKIMLLVSSRPGTQIRITEFQNQGSIRTNLYITLLRK